MLADFLALFRVHMQIQGEFAVTETYYKTGEPDNSRYESLLNDYNHHVGLVQDLMVELTRAANLVCERVRETISPRFRWDEGIVLARTGMGPDGKERMLRLFYRGELRTESALPRSGKIQR